VDAIRALKGRIVSSHLKDLHEFSPNGHDTVYGTGVSDVKGILAAYRDIQMKGTVSVEYEYDWDDNQPEVAECLKVLSKGF
jgi:sugar phosphate isomerase/epimerase